jgi:hypothetical protein
LTEPSRFSARTETRPGFLKWGTIHVCGKVAQRFAASALRPILRGRLQDLNRIDRTLNQYLEGPLGLRRFDADSCCFSQVKGHRQKLVDKYRQKDAPDMSPDEVSNRCTCWRGLGTQIQMHALPLPAHIHPAGKSCPTQPCGCHPAQPREKCCQPHLIRRTQL